MKKEELKSAFENIEPSEELKENVKLKMFKCAIERDAKKSTKPAFFARISTALCAVMLCLFAFSALGIQRFTPHSYKASFENENANAVQARAISYHIEDDTKAVPAADYSAEDFKVFLAALTEDYRALGVNGTVVSENMYIMDEASEYGIYAFAIIDVKIDRLFFSENEPFFGVKSGDTVSFVKYFYEDPETYYYAEFGEILSFYAYTGKNMIPFDTVSESLKLENAFIIY